ncbi:MAG: DoxX family membrane protein [Bacteroidetes bacterium]|nr:DoxX family membrane protein [Bacteroidota bacterium]MDA1268519.1 DoxX family membrane protein [Bacteroidota bacterium]
MKERVVKIIRVLLALILIIFGLNKFLNFMPLPPMPEPAQAFMGALIETGYLMVIVAIVEIIAGIFLLINRYSAFMLILIFPILVNALLFHLFLDLKGIGGALLTISLTIFLMVKAFDTYKILLSKS